MEKILDALVDEITTRVIARLEANTSNMFSALKIKTKAENVEGLEDLIDGRIAEKLEDEVNRDEVREMATEAAEEVLKNASFDVSVHT